VLYANPVIKFRAGEALLICWRSSSSTLKALG
jgi:hypothetical protein